MLCRARARVTRWLVLLGVVTGPIICSVSAVAGEEAWDRSALALKLLGAWSEPMRTAVIAALSRLPRPIIARGPKAIVADGVRCDEEGWPDDEHLIDGAGVVHLCHPANATPEMIARQAAVAWILAFDRAAGWSSDAAWRRLNGWSSSVTSGWVLRPENDEVLGFASPRGRRSPAWDLATFMEAWLLDPARGEGGIGCRLISQARFVAGRLGAEDARLQRCEAFERWADLERLDGVEVVLAAPSTAMVGSLFGHLFVRLAYRDEDGRAPLHLSRTVAFLADNDVPFEADPSYALKGIAGLYRASLHERPFLDAYREYVVLEGRDLRRWRLNLTTSQARELMERIWTVVHAGRYPYYFFRRNCATLMVDLINSILPPARDRPVTGWLASPPASTLEPWQRELGDDGQALLQFVSDPILSFDHQARLTSRHRLSVEARLGLQLDAAEASALAVALHDSHSSDPGARASAYQRVALIFSDPRSGADADVHAWLRDTGAIESYLSTLANEQAEAREEKIRRVRVRTAADDLARELHREAASLRTGEQQSGRADQGARLESALHDLESTDPTRRLDGYRALASLAPAVSQPALSARVRRLALFVSEARYDVGRMQQSPGLRDALLFVDVDKPIDEQPYVAGFGDLIRPPVETRIALPLRSLQHAKEVLFAVRDLEGAIVAADMSQETTAVRHAYDASLSRSGIDQVAILGGVTAGGGAPPLGGVVLDGALYDERLGDHRRLGFPSDTALVVARSSALFGVASGVPVVAAYDARAFGYRSLRLPLPEAGGSRFPIGWETYVDVCGSRARDLDAEVKVAWGWLAELGERADLRDHLLAGLGLAYEGYFPASAAPVAGAPQAVAAPLSLEVRWGLGADPRYRSWLAARAWGEPIFPFSGAPPTLRTDIGVAAELHAALPERFKGHDPALLLRGEVRRTEMTFTGSAATIEVLAALGVELR